MPFERLIPHPFTAGGVRMYAPTVSGVYGISNSHEWIYIGESDDIRGALLAHLGESTEPVMQHQPAGFVFEACSRAQRSSRQDRLVAEYGPACNRHTSRHQ